jgi:hypothetical protein
MSRVQFAVVVGVALVGSLLGGMLSPWCHGRPAVAAEDIPKVIVAREFRLVDEQGRPRGWFAINSLGASRVALSGDDGEPRAVLGVMRDGSAAGLTLTHSSGQMAAGLVAGPLRGAVGLVMSDERGRPKASLGLDPKGEPVLGFSDKDGKPCLSLAGGASEGPRGLSAKDNKGRLRFSLALGPSLPPSLVLWDGDGEVFWHTPER